MHSPHRLAGLDLTMLLLHASQLTLAEFVRRMDAAGYAELRPLHGMAFQALGAEGATGTELAGRLGVTKQAVSQLVADLERWGYVARRPHPAGGKRVLIALTGKAHEHLAVADRTMRELTAELAARLPPGTIERLRGDLAALVDAVEPGPLPPLRPL